MICFASQDTFLSSLVVIANEVQKRLSGDFSEVKKLVDDNTLVVAIWQDLTEAEGVGMMIIKGQKLLREVIASNQSLPASLTVIPCVEAAQAAALLEFAGDRDLLH